MTLPEILEFLLAAEKATQLALVETREFEVRHRTNLPVASSLQWLEGKAAGLRIAIDLLAAEVSS